MNTQELRANIDACAQLDDGWDGYVAPRPNLGAITDSWSFIIFNERVIRDHGYDISICPMCDGGITLVFSRDGSEHFIDFDNENVMHIEPAEDTTDQKAWDAVWTQCRLSPNVTVIVWLW